MLFYTPHIEGGFARLDEEESRHLLTVLRRQPGDRLRLTDGRGNFYEAELAEVGKKQALARILTQETPEPERVGRLHLAVAPTKQMERYEWMLEKTTELGVDEITPLICKRSERSTVRADRLEKILVSAMKQSLRATLPLLHPPTTFQQLVKNATAPQRRIAWCTPDALPHLKSTLRTDQDALILIGPEGDFTPDEVALALQCSFIGVDLGSARLRTETAGILAAAVFLTMNEEI